MNKSLDGYQNELQSFIRQWNMFMDELNQNGIQLLLEFSNEMLPQLSEAQRILRIKKAVLELPDTREIVP